MWSLLKFNIIGYKKDKFLDFLKSLVINLDYSFESNPFLATVIGDFNAKSNKWSENDKWTIERRKNKFLTSHFGLSQIINQPTNY